MSCYVVARRHIDFLVSALIEHQITPPNMDPDHLGRLLWRENERSFTSRYGGRYPEDIPDGIGDYTHTSYPVPDVYVTEVQVACYSYQSCEHSGWTGSTAYHYVSALRTKLIATIREKYPTYKIGDSEPDNLHTVPEQRVIGGGWGINDD